MNHVPQSADILYIRLQPAQLRRIRSEVLVSASRQVLAIKQVAELFHVSTDTVYGLDTSGELQGRKNWSHLAFPKDTIESYIREQRAVVTRYRDLGSNIGTKCGLDETGPRAG